MLPPSVQHCIWMVSVPVVYPRLEAVETLANTLATGKKAVNTTYNILGKVTSSVAGVVGGQRGRRLRASATSRRPSASRASWATCSTSFGEFDIAEELKDLVDARELRTSRAHATSSGRCRAFAHQKGHRMTFLSGGMSPFSPPTLLLTHLTTADYLLRRQLPPAPVSCMIPRTRVTTRPCTRLSHRPSWPQPAGNYVMRMLHNNKMLYVPQNGAQVDPRSVRTPRRI